MTPVATMAYTDKHLRREINALLDGLAVRRESWRPQWIALEICDAHRSGLAGDDENIHVAFWLHTGYTWARKLTTDCVNDRTDDDPPISHEPFLPGFEHLQQYYVVRRDGEDISVHLFNLTDEEIRERAALKRHNAATELAHAEELERFIEWRKVNPL